MRLLFICTGNLCRSPVAERLMAERARRSPDRGAVTIRSAGLAAPADRPMHPRSAEALLALGGDPTGFMSRRFEAEMATGAQLVLTMTRAQRRTVLRHTPRGLRRTFTLLEAADLLTRVDLTGLDTIAADDRAAALAVRLDAARALRASKESDDIADPVDGGVAAHRAAAEAITTALRPLADVLVGPEPAHPAGTPDDRSITLSG